MGKRGVGKSTTAANLTAALAEAGRRVLLSGYDPHRNTSATTLRGAGSLVPFPEWAGGCSTLWYAPGFRNSLCIEVGELLRAEDTAQSAYLLRHPVVTGYGPEFVV